VSNYSDPPLRTVVQEPVVSAVIDAESQRFDRLADVVSAFEWLLARTPEKGYPVPDTTDPEFYLISNESIEVLNVPQVTLLYYFDDNTVTLFSIRVQVDD
jgi:hypothetical protein